MEIHDQRSCDRDQDLKDQGKDRDKDWSSFIPTADAENKNDLESSPKNEIGKKQKDDFLWGKEGLSRRSELWGATLSK